MELVPPATNAQLRHGAAVIRRPLLTDAAAIHGLVEDSETLDMNSRYLYLLLCRDFALTSRVAEINGEVIGFVTAYIPPDQPNVLFIWQIAVAPSHRGCGVAMRMLTDLLAGLPESQSFTIEATITPSNIASQNVFKSLARRLGCEIRSGDGFNEALFAPEAHEVERMFYIGPLVIGPDKLGVQKKEVKP